MADESDVKRQTTRQDEPVTIGEKGNNQQSLRASESSDNEPQVKEFKEGGYGWYVLHPSFGQSALTVDSPGLSSPPSSSSICTPGA